MQPMATRSVPLPYQPGSNVMTFVTSAGVSLRHKIYPSINLETTVARMGKHKLSTVDTASQLSKYDALSNASTSSINPTPANAPEYPEFYGDMSSNSASSRAWIFLQAFSVGNHLSLPDQGIFPSPTCQRREASKHALDASCVSGARFLCLTPILLTLTPGTLINR